MRRFLAAASVAAFASLALSVPAQAADLEYVALNEKGLKQTLLKKSWAPGWLGKLDLYKAEVLMGKGQAPTECATTDSIITSKRSADYAYAYMDFAQNKEGHLLDVAQFVYQYKDVAKAEQAWQILLDAAGACAGTKTHSIKDDSGKVIGTATTVVEVITEPGMYGQQQLIINEDVRYDEPLPGGADTRASADQISIWMYDGMTIIETESNKYVPKQKNWVFSPPQIATIETLALVTIQRYHLAALRAV
jgi:hypothetical protein